MNKTAEIISDFIKRANEYLTKAELSKDINTSEYFIKYANILLNSAEKRIILLNTTPDVFSE